MCKKKERALSIADKFTHKELCTLARSYLMNTMKMGVAFEEMVTYEREQPDAIGFKGGGDLCIVLEVKRSRADFLKDKKKFFRKHPERGMGKFRYYVAPAGLISVAELPEKWGLLEVNEHGKIRRVHGANLTKYEGHKDNKPFTFTERNVSAEQTVMYAMLRRLQIRIKDLQEFTKAEDDGKVPCNLCTYNKRRG